jgi:hypothetical protein
MRTAAFGGMPRSARTMALLVAVVVSTLVVL